MADVAVVRPAAAACRDEVAAPSACGSAATAADEVRPACLASWAVAAADTPDAVHPVRRDVHPVGPGVHPRPGSVSAAWLQAAAPCVAARPQDASQAPAVAPAAWACQAPRCAGELSEERRAATPAGAAAATRAPARRPVLPRRTARRQPASAPARPTAAAAPRRAAAPARLRARAVAPRQEAAPRHAPAAPLPWAPAA